MVELYGQRWTNEHGTEPSELWQLAIDSATDAQVKRGLHQLLGKPHPPALTEFVALMKPEAAKAAKAGAEAFTPEWREARREVMAQIARKQHGIDWTPAQRAQSDAAVALVENPPGTVGHAAASDAYRCLPRSAA
jgi:hypothetical protein